MLSVIIRLETVGKPRNLVTNRFEECVKMKCCDCLGHTYLAVKTMVFASFFYAKNLIATSKGP